MTIIIPMLQKGVPNFTTLPENMCCFESFSCLWNSVDFSGSRLVPQLISILIRSLGHPGGFQDIILCFLHQFSREVAREDEHRLQNRLLQRLGLCSSWPPRRSAGLLSRCCPPHLHCAAVWSHTPRGVSRDGLSKTTAMTWDENHPDLVKSSLGGWCKTQVSPQRDKRVHSISIMITAIEIWIQVGTKLETVT